LVKPEGTVVSVTYCGALNVLEPVVAYFDSMVATRLLNEPEALESDPEVEYDDALTLSIELDNAEPVASRAVTLVLKDPLAADNDPEVADNDPLVADNDPEVADNDPEVADREPEVAYAELLTVYNEAEVVLNELVNVNTVLSKPSSKSALVT
jgi:hypothetical protein